MSAKILVIDDNYKNIRLIKDILEEEDFEVFTAESGCLVFDITHKIKPDAILLDIMMPEMDGFEVCRLLKNDFETKDIPVLMVTAKTDGYDIKKALEIGAFDYIKKPIDEIEVIARVQSALRFKQQQDKLKEMASKDGLTGLFNHKLLIELFEREFRKQERNKGNISFVMIDIDFFKKVNDTYGHTSGDLILKVLADILIDSTRSSDIVGRYGGEEFSIVISENSAESVFQLCDRIRKFVESYNFNIGKELINITVSLGIYFKAPNDTISGLEMIKKADQALYKAKQNGRNRVEIYIKD